MKSGVESEFLENCVSLLESIKKGMKEDEVQKVVRSLADLASKSPELAQNLSENDIRHVIYDTQLYLNKKFAEASTSEFRSYVQQNLLTTRTYHFFFPIYQLFQYPGGKELGYGTTILFGDIPSEVKESFISDWNHNFGIHTEWARTKEELVERKAAAAFLKLELKANGNDKAMDRAVQLAEDSVNVLRFVYQVNFPIGHSKFYLDNGQGSGGTGMPFFTFQGAAWYNARLEPYIQTLSEILSDATPQDIEKRVRAALKIFGIQTKTEDRNVRLLLLISCLEGLLLSPSDRDYLGWRVAEKTTFLLGKDEGNRKEIFEFITESYDKRSRFAHQDQRSGKEVTENDLLQMIDVIQGLVHRLLELMNEGYSQIQKDPQKSTIDGFVEVEKFR